MADPWNALRRISGGRVLDAATGSGGFALLLADRLAGWTEIVGIDTNPKAAAAFEASTAGRPGIRFEARDALSTGWPDASFDTVAVANSLHHFPEALAEVGRAIDAYLVRAKGTPDAGRLIGRGEELRSRVARTGFLGAPGLLAVGRNLSASHLSGTNSKSDTTTS